MRKFCILIGLILFGLIGAGDVLQWQIDQNAIIDNDSNITLYSFLAPDTEIGALACVYDVNGNFLSNLNLVYDPEYADSFVSSRDELWIMQAIQSYMDDDQALDSIFQLQVGYYDEDYNFVTALYSETESKAGLLANHSYTPGSLAPPSTDWIPHSFYTINPVVPSIPEPSSSLLLLVGASLLTLKRKRK